LTPLEVRDRAPRALDELSAELEVRLGLSRRCDGRAAVGFVETSGGCELLTVAAEIDHSKTRGCVPPSVVPAEDGTLLESFEAVVVLAPRRRQQSSSSDAAVLRRCALLTAGASRIGAKAVEWLEKRFDCYALQVPALPPESLASIATLWALCADGSAAGTTLALSFAPPEGSRGVADITLEVPLAVLPRVERGSRPPSIAKVLAPVCRRLCGVDIAPLQLLAFSTPDASLNINAEVALFSHSFPLSLLLDIVNT